MGGRSERVFNGAAHPGVERLYEAEREEHVLELGVHLTAPVEALLLVEVLDGHGGSSQLWFAKVMRSAYT